MLVRLACLAVGYLCGSVLTAELVARRMTGHSVFELGDGNPGTANVGHELGTGAAIGCLVSDIVKTLVPILVMSWVVPSLAWPVVCAWVGLGATLGHIFPFWHRFRGGKGVATIASAIVLMQPMLGGLAAVIGLLAIIVGGYLSAAAVVAAVFFFLATIWMRLPVDCLIVTFAFVLLTCHAHGPKLRGIRTGETHRASIATKFWSLFGK